MSNVAQSILHFPGMTLVQGPYTVDYTEISHDGNTKSLFTPQIGDVIVGVFTNAATVIDALQGGLPFNNGGLKLGTVALPGSLMTANAFLNFSAFGIFLGQFLPLVVSSPSPVNIKWDAQGDSDLTAGHADLFFIVTKSPVP